MDRELVLRYSLIHLRLGKLHNANCGHHFNVMAYIQVIGGVRGGALSGSTWRLGDQGEPPHWNSIILGRGLLSQVTRLLLALIGGPRWSEHCGVLLESVE